MLAVQNSPDGTPARKVGSTAHTDAMKKVNKPDVEVAQIDVGRRAEVIRKRAHKKLGKLEFRTEIPEEERAFVDRNSASPSGDIMGDEDSVKVATDILSSINNGSLVVNNLPVAFSDYECVFDNNSGYGTQKKISDPRHRSTLRPSDKFSMNVQRHAEIVAETKKDIDSIRRLPRVVLERTVRLRTDILAEQRRKAEEDARLMRRRGEKAAEVAYLSDDGEEDIMETRERHLWETLGEGERDLLFR